MKPRRLTDTESASLVNALRNASPKGQVEIVCVLGDGDGFAFASQIDTILKAAGWPTTGVSQAAFGPGGNPIGFGIMVRAAATAPPYAVALQSAFTAAGLRIAGAEAAGLAEGTVRLVIGNKPQ